MKKYSIIFGPADVSHTMKDMCALYEDNAHIKKRFQHFSECSEIPVDVLLKKQSAPETLTTVQLTSVGLLAGMLGIADTLCDLKGKPACVGGISLGELTAMCFSSALSVETAVSLIMLENKCEPITIEEQCIGFVFVPDGLDHLYYQKHKGMYIAVDYGQIHGGAGRLLMVSGLRSVLENQGQQGNGDLEVLPPDLCNTAYHSELRKPVSNAIAEYLSDHPLKDARVPILSCFDDLRVLLSDQDIKTALVRSECETLYVPKLLEQQHIMGVEETCCVGPFLRSLNMEFGMPCSFYDEQWVLAEA